MKPSLVAIAAAFAAFTVLTQPIVAQSDGGNGGDGGDGTDGGDGQADQNQDGGGQDDQGGETRFRLRRLTEINDVREERTTSLWTAADEAAVLTVEGDENRRGRDWRGDRDDRRRYDWRQDRGGEAAEVTDADEYTADDISTGAGEYAKTGGSTEAAELEDGQENWRGDRDWRGGGRDWRRGDWRYRNDWRRNGRDRGDWRRGRRWG